MRWGVFILLGLAIASLSCAKKGGSGAGTTIYGVVQAGRVTGATVQVYKLKDGERDSLIGESSTNRAGAFIVSVPIQSTPVEVVVKGGSYKDEATGLTVRMESGDELTAVVENSSGEKQTPITPITTQVAERVKEQVETGNVKEEQFASAKGAAEEEVAQVYGVSKDVITALPNSPDAPGSSQSNAAKGAYLLATLSQYVKDKNLGPDQGVSPFDVLTELSNDLKKDGKLDGKNEGTPISSNFATVSTGWTNGMAAAAENLKTNEKTQTFKAFDKGSMGIGQFKNEPENKMNAVSSAGQTQVTICHIPPGNPENKHSITIGEAAVQAHLDHGDYRGECISSGSSSDTTAPTVGVAISFSNIASTSVTVTWGAASDAVTSAANLQYKVVRASACTAIDTIDEADAISGASLAMNWTTNTTSVSVTGLTGGTTYCFAVLVKDEAGNKAIYTTASRMAGKIIYFTTTTFVGNLGGVSGADSKCSVYRASGVNSSSVVKAFLVDGTNRVACTTNDCSGGTTEHVDWVLTTSTNYYNTSGQLVWTTRSNAAYVDLSSSVNMPGNITDVTSGMFWSGFAYTDGSDWLTSGNFPTGDCNNWTDGAFASTGTNWRHTGELLYTAVEGCGELRYLLCVEQ